ncbi:MAG: hypothetical protein ACI8XC_003785, partial [Gammaproteobacteria bacterium]
VHDHFFQRQVLNWHYVFGVTNRAENIVASFNSGKIFTTYSDIAIFKEMFLPRFNSLTTN